jgi:hypothetical protein
MPRAGWFTCGIVKGPQTPHSTFFFLDVRCPLECPIIMRIEQLGPQVYSKGLLVQTRDGVVDESDRLAIVLSVGL